MAVSRWESGDKLRFPMRARSQEVHTVHKLSRNRKCTQCVTQFRNIFAEGGVNVGEYSPSRRRGKYSPIFTEPETNNCFNIISELKNRENDSLYETKATSTLSRINLKTQLLPRNRIKCSPSTLIVFKLFRCPH